MLGGGLSDVSDDAIKQIVQRVLQQAMGLSPAAPPITNLPPPSVTPEPVKDSAAEHKAVAIGADHGGFDLKETLKTEISALGYEVIDAGTGGREAVDYPDFAHAVASMVSAGKAWRGIVVDGAGIGSCMVANKVPGVRAGMAYDYSSAVNGREHNDANVLTLGAGLIGVNLARQIVQVWLATPFGGGRHARRVEKITAMERLHLK